jgi:hypothetical protein
MTDRQRKAYENPLGRMAARQGLRLTRSGRRDRRARDYGLYYLLDPDTGGVVGLGGGDGYDLEDVHRYLLGEDLTEPRRER